MFTLENVIFRSLLMLEKSRIFDIFRDKMSQNQWLFNRYLNCLNAFDNQHLYQEKLSCFSEFGKQIIV